MIYALFFCYILLFFVQSFFYLQIVIDLMMYLCQAENAGFYPPEIVNLKGRMMLFKVEKTTSAGVMFDGSFRVKRVCVNPSIIEEFSTSAKVCELLSFFCICGPSLECLRFDLLPKIGYFLMTCCHYVIFRTYFDILIEF